MATTLPSRLCKNIELVKSFPHQQEHLFHGDLGFRCYWLVQAGGNSLTRVETPLPASLETLVLMNNELTSLDGASQAAQGSDIWLTQAKPMV